MQPNRPLHRCTGVELLFALWFSLGVSAGHGLCAEVDHAAVRLSDANRSMLEESCFDCHSGNDSQAGLDLEGLLKVELQGESLEQNFGTWVRIFDRVESGEMPPPDDYGQLDSEVQSAFSEQLGEILRNHQSDRQERLGRVQGRRLTNLQLERTLHDLLGVDIPLEREMPEPPKSESYTTNAASQMMSHFHLQQHIHVVDLALDEAFRRALSKPDEQTWELSPKKLSRTRRRTREPEFIDNSAVTWSSSLAFYGRLPATTARESGWYEFEFEVEGLKAPKGRNIWCSVRTGSCVSSSPLMTWVGSFEATKTPRTVTFTTWLPKGHMLEVRPADTTLKKAKFRGGQSGTGEGGKQDVPGLAINWMRMSRIHRGADDQGIRELLFGALAEQQPAGEIIDSLAGELNTQELSKHADQLIKAFATRAFRRPVEASVAARFQAVFDDQYAELGEFLPALRTAYRSILCSPRFMHFQEMPGRLDDFAIANRLSYLILNRPPDAELVEAAAAGKLSGSSKSSRNEIRRQVDRMLSDNGEEFVRDFANEWLELSEINFTTPDRRMHPDFDSIVQDGMVQETITYLVDMLEHDRSVRNFVKSNYTFANNRLGRFYDLAETDTNASEEEIDGNKRISLSEGEHRGGLLTHGSILKVTANGTNTSPVIRGVWVSRRILGQEIPPPPSNVPAIEPDIRGATSIRDQLEKHRSLSECASCHAKIDPPGFALENFDAAGKWREYYPKVIGKNRSRGTKIDASYVTATGKRFANVHEFSELAAANIHPIAKNFARQLLAYGTGAAPTFADRIEIDQIVQKASKRDYGMRTILYEAVCSSIFLNK
ncbi:MAG: DUF1588 domain-containing protein [Aureliella sp.]